MIDVNKNILRILPAEHIVFKDFDYAVAVEKKSKLLEKAIFGVITVGVLVLIFYVIKDAESRNKK
jgi:hypothetical protein